MSVRSLCRRTWDRSIEIPTLFCDLRSIPVKFHSIWFTFTFKHKNSIKVNSYEY